MVLIETRGAFVFATLAAPATRNALTDAMVGALGDAIARAEAHADTRALVIRGAGGTFCAGGDFGSFRTLMSTPAPAAGPDPIATANRAFGRLLERLHACVVPTIAVVDGAAMGGGIGLAAACDLVLAASDARLATPEVTLGLPPAQIAPFVAARVGDAAARRLLLTGRRVDAAQALALGLVDELHAPSALDAALHALLDELGRAEPGALRATKAVLRHHDHESFGATLDFAAGKFAAALRSGTAAEGLAALGAKRPAAWVTTPDAAAP